MKFALLYILLMICLVAKPQNPTDLFRNFKNWDIISYGFNVVFDKETNNMFEAFSIPNILFKDQEPFSFNLQQSILLPQDSIIITFDFKNRRIETLTLKLLFYGEEERLIDSLVYQLRPEGHNSIKFENHNAEWVDITLNGQSKNNRDTISIQITDASISAKNHDLDEWFMSLDLKIDVNKLFPLKKVTELDEFKNKKIIGLGESVHGTRTIMEEEIVIAKKLLDKNVKIICFEEPVDVGLNMDLYVRGIHPSHYRNVILGEMTNSLNDAGDMMKFLDVIRKVNTTRKENDKIRIIGLDLRSDKRNFLYYFISYKNLSKNKQFLTSLILKTDSLSYDNISHKNSTINNSIQSYDTKSNEFSKLATLLQYEKHLKTMMLEKDYHFLSDVLALNIPTFNDNHNDNSIDRDKIMWTVFQKAMSCYAPNENERAVIFAHSLHLSRTCHENRSNGFINKRSLGSYIANNYPNDYWVISFHTGSGEIKSFDKISNFFRNDIITGVEKLPDPVPGSFEREAKNIILDRFYYKSSDLSNDLYKYRMVGNQSDKNQFYALTKSRFDAYVYINNSVAGRTGTFGYDFMQPANKSHYYLDSLRCSNVLYSKTFAFESECFDITVPKNFKYKNYHSSIIPRTNRTGFFESKDKNCLIVVDEAVSLYDIKGGFYSHPEVMKLLKKDITKEVTRELMQSLKMNIDGSNMGGNLGALLNLMANEKETENSNFEKMYDNIKDKVVDVKSAEYAQKAFNADKLIEFFVYVDLYFMGNYYPHKQVIITEKNDDILTLYCYYTDLGFDRKEKYRQGIENILKFH